ncbi:unnamed protein product [Brachionus calyciflorus]|uniref:Alpha-1,4-N-acetylglucosaminyltransferase n=1 Tax=Brachionus calyciflorus TaxID=104777 RepID=A0A814CLF4_9BILA|nr:unnamed protein product [Brachionus calyciflorus]
MLLSKNFVVFLVFLQFSIISYATYYYIINTQIKIRLPSHASLLETEGVSYLPRQDTENIFLIWFGENYPLVYFKCLETLVFHHPKADVLIFSNELDENLVEPFWKKGYQNVRVVRFNLTILGRDKPGFDFVIKATKLLRNETLDSLIVTSVHLSDFLRYLLVYTYGGFYIDSDSFVIRNFLKLKNSISVSDNFSYRCTKKVYNSPNAKNFTCLTNCFFHFDRHHAFMRDALEMYDVYWTRYQGYGPGGAGMLINLIEKSFDKINFVSNIEVVCARYISITASNYKMDDPKVQKALKTCYTLQILGGGRSTLNFTNFDKSFMGQVYSKSKIF